MRDYSRGFRHVKESLDGSKSLSGSSDGYRITTAEILYWMPDHRHVLQSFVWQNPISRRAFSPDALPSISGNATSTASCITSASPTLPCQAGLSSVSRQASIRAALSVAPRHIPPRSAPSARPPTGSPKHPRPECPGAPDVLPALGVWLVALGGIDVLAMSMLPRHRQVGGIEPAASIEGRSMLVSSPEGASAARRRAGFSPAWTCRRPLPGSREWR